MATVERRAARSSRITRRALAEIGDEIRRARIAAGTSQAVAGSAVGRSRTHVSRIERGSAPNATVRELVRLGAVVGLDVVVRAYPAGPPLRDRAHLQLLQRLRVRLHPRLGWRTEVPLDRPGDPRAWDAMIAGAGRPIMVEAETRLTDLQALERRIALKARDTGTERVLLLVADTRGNRAFIRVLPTAMSWLAAQRSADVLDALAAGIDPGGCAVILL